MPILVTGMGLCTSLGSDIRSNWDGLAGVSKGKLPRSSKTGYSRAQELIHDACTEAFRYAGLPLSDLSGAINPERVGCTVSASKPLFSHSAQLGSDPKMHHHGAKGDLTPVVHSPDEITDYARNQFGLQGESRNVIAACATGAYSIALAASWIEQGLCDIVVAGSVEPLPHPLIESGFRQMGVTSIDGATRPFDKHRSGFTFGEGAGIVILESTRSYERRSSKNAVRPNVVLSGWALGADSHSAVAFNSNGARISDVIGRALARAHLDPAAIRHVNAHGTATHINDWIENQALLKAFGAHAKNLMISATKASTGHLLGASGSVEFILTALALQNQFIPPTATLESADPECSLDYTPRVGHSASFDHALSLSFGFGGPIGALIVSRC